MTNLEDINNRLGRMDSRIQRVETTVVNMFEVVKLMSDTLLPMSEEVSQIKGDTSRIVKVIGEIQIDVEIIKGYLNSES